MAILIPCHLHEACLNTRFMTTSYIGFAICSLYHFSMCLTSSMWVIKIRET